MREEDLAACHPAACDPTSYSDPWQRMTTQHAHAGSEQVALQVYHQNNYLGHCLFKTYDVRHVDWKDIQDAGHLP